MNNLDNSLDSDNLYNWNLSNSDSEHSNDDILRNKAEPAEYAVVKKDSKIVSLQKTLSAHTNSYGAQGQGSSLLTLSKQSGQEDSSHL